MSKVEYKILRPFGSPDSDDWAKELNSAAKEGWRIVPPLCSFLYNDSFILMEREVPETKTPAPETVVERRVIGDDGKFRIEQPESVWANLERATSPDNGYYFTEIGEEPEIEIVKVVRGQYLLIGCNRWFPVLGDQRFWGPIPEFDRPPDEEIVVRDIPREHFERTPGKVEVNPNSKTREMTLGQLSELKPGGFE